MRKTFIIITVLAVLAGCAEAPPEKPATSVFLAWGRKGSGPGMFNKPRAAAFDARGILYVADMTGRVQKFSAEGKYILDWKTPDIEKGRPRALFVDSDGTVLVSDCHYYKVRRYSAEGKLLSSWGKRGKGPGEFALMTDITADKNGNIYTTQFQEDSDAVQVFTREGRFIRRFGRRGEKEGEFSRPMGIAVDNAGFIYVADCCNHRVQKFTAEGKFVKAWGGHGKGRGRMQYPYDIICDPRGRLLVAEYGNNRISKYSANGGLLAVWGGGGTGAGMCLVPWGAAACDEKDVYYIVDTGNNRIQRVRIADGTGVGDAD
jgi:DNA-binding beta-propeller fold protein YncE